MIELSEAQRQALSERPGLPVEVIDPATGRVYLLVEAERYQREAGRPEERWEDPPIVIPPGIQRAKAAFRRDLPQLLADKRLRGQYVAYAWGERIGIGKREQPLIQECFRRGFADEEFYIGVIEPLAAVEEEEVSCGLFEAEEDEPDPPPRTAPR